MSQFVVNIDGTVEQDKVFICDRLLNIQGQLSPIEDLKTIMRLNQNDEVSFKIYKNNNGNINPFWDKIDDIAIILVEGKGYFEISVPSTQDDCVYKDITGISLGEAETSQTNITIEINTEDDIARNDYIPTVLYDNNDTDGSLLHRIFKSMPHYSIGHVDASVAGLQRTFSCDDQPIYDFLQTVAEELECIFIFDNFKREVDCYDLKDHCNRKSCITSGDYRNVKNGVCQCCHTSDYVSYGYGKDSGVYMDSNNLVESVTLTGDKDSVKNCFKIEGGDDVITNMLGTRLMDGNYIWKFSPHQISQMSEPLQRALTDRVALVDSYQDEYNELWDKHNEKTDNVLFYQSGMMPSIDTDSTTARSVYDEIFGAKIQYACLSSKLQTASSVLSDVERFAKLIAPKEYEVKTALTSSSTSLDGSTSVVSSISFSVHISLKDAYKENNTIQDEYSGNVTLSVKRGYNMIAGSELDSNNNSIPIFSTDYYLYLKQKLEMTLEKSDVSDDVISFDPPFTNGSLNGSITKYANYDNETNPENLSSIHYTMYSINRLKSFRDAYESCSQIIAKLNSDIASDTTSILKYVNSSGGKTSIYDDLLKKYYSYIACIDARIAYLEGIVNGLNSEIVTLESRISEIKDICNMEKFLKSYENGIHGDDLWLELCSFKREDIYRNENYVGDGYSNTIITENVEGLIKRATEELERACEINYSINTTIGNLLTMWEFQPLWDDFTLGNWIRIRIDEDVYKLRLISVTFDYSDLSHIEVEFSDVTKTNNPITDIKSILQQASSVTSNFNSVSRQAEKGNMTNQEFKIMKEYGLDVANMMITSANTEIPTMDNNGITCRTWDDTKNDYSDEQMRLIHNLLCFTSDSWQHTRLALGKILYYNDEKSEYEFAYGLNAEVLISNLILSECLKIYNKSGTYSMTNDGFIMQNNNKYIKFLPENPSVEFNNGTNSILEFNTPNHKDTLWLSGTLEASTIKSSEFIGGVLKSNTWTSNSIASNPSNGIYFDLVSSQLVMYSNGVKIFDFNYTEEGSLLLRAGLYASIITGGLITGSIIKSDTWIDNNICIPPIEGNGVYFNLNQAQLSMTYNGNEIFGFNNKVSNTLNIGKWLVDSSSIYTNNSYYNIIMNSTGQIFSYAKSSKNNYAALLVEGKWSFGKWVNDDIYGIWDENSDKVGHFYWGDGYTDISYQGIYVRSKQAENNNLSVYDYTFAIDTSNDTIKINSFSDNIALHVTNWYTGDTLYLENTKNSSNSRVLHCKVYANDEYRYLSVFGEKLNKNRLVVRADSSYDFTEESTGSYSPCTDSALGTVNYPWGEAYALYMRSENFDTQTFTTLSDRKVKKNIENLDKQKSLAFIKSLTAVTYNLINSKNDRTHMGFIAQDVAQTCKDLEMGDMSIYSAEVVDDNNEISYYDENVNEENLKWGLRYNEFEAPIIASIQLLSDIIGNQEKNIEEQNEKIEKLIDRLEKLESLLQNQGLS